MAKKYISKIVKGGNTMYMKDEEARTAIANVASVAETTAALAELT